MSQTFRNLILVTIWLPAVIWSAWFLRFGWSEALVANRTFTVYFDLLSAATLLVWLFYLVFFFAIGILLAAVLRSGRLWAWSIGFGLAYVTFRLAYGRNWIAPDAGVDVYLSLLGEYTMPIVGCWLGTLATVAARQRLAPNNSFKPKPLRGSA